MQRNASGDRAPAVALPTQIARGGSSPGATMPAAAAAALALASLPISVLFTDGAWVAPVLMAILVTCVTGGLLRALPVPLLVVPFAQTAAFGAALSLMFGADAGGVGFTALRDLVTDGILEVRGSVAPVEATPQVLALLAVLVFLAALLVETFAVGLGLAGLGGTVLLAMATVPLGLRPHSPLPLLAAAGLGWLILLAADQSARLRVLPRPDPTVAEGRSGDLAGLAGMAASTIAGTLIVLLVAAPSAAQAPWLRTWWKDLAAGRAADAAALDPFVSVRDLLVRGSSRELLSYRSTDEQAKYLRLTTLETFDGTSWLAAPVRTGPDVAQPAPLAGPYASGPSVRVWVGALKNDRLPLPDHAVTVALAPDTRGDWRWDLRTGDAVSDGTPASGASYTVRTSPVPDASALARSGGLERNLDTSAPDVPEEVAALAAEVTAASGSDYARAVALQGWFTSGGGFRYSLSVPSAAGRHPMVAFLTDRAGYCQQFASTMAAMAQTLGIQARVVVGFAAGTAEPDGSFVVSARDAHAWPELWFDGAGWVRFEPTPGAGTATLQQPSAAAAATPEPAAAPTPSASAVPEGLETDAGQGEGEGGGGRWLLLVAAAAAVLALAAVVPRAARARIRRRLLARTAAGDADAAWREVGSSAWDAGADWRPGDSARQQAASVFAVLEPSDADGCADALWRLVSHVEHARYAPPGAVPAVAAVSLVVPDSFPGLPSTPAVPDPYAAAGPGGASPGQTGPQPGPSLLSDTEMIVGLLDRVPRGPMARLAPVSLLPRPRP